LSSDLSKLLATDIKNVYYSSEGTVKRIPFEGNAVIVHLFPERDYEGKKTYKRIVTIALKDKKMLKPLKKEAYRILGG